MTEGLFRPDRVDQQALRRRSLTRWADAAPGVIPLTVAEPDFPAPPMVTEAMMAYLADGYLPYAPEDGMAELRQAVASVCQRRYGIEATAAQIVLTPGTAAAIWTVVHALSGPDRECVLLDPVDLLFGQAVDAAGARRLLCPVDKVTGRLDLDRLDSLVTSRTSLVLLCSPHNPLGAVLPEETVRAVAAIAARHGVPVVSDEVWNEIVYPPARHVSTAAVAGDLGAPTYTLLGLSKTFALPGLRIGFVVAPDEAAARVLRATVARLGMAHTVSPLAQVAAVTALRSGWPWRDRLVDHLHRTRDHCVRRFNAIPGVSCRSPDATYVLFPDISAFGLSSEQFARSLLDSAEVAVVPGTPEWFGPGAAGNIRVSFATSESILDNALDRFEQFTRSLDRRAVRQ
ncbi:pyridoxal phosphate-dependent aminotransferase [Streptomyces sp. NPDC002588]|uniref:pyridoxal phosphate-dependent aminotransferase n=1 Tax=Streptomyces sp. NPDC002588 TaxID=3154419 RepID=UPI00333045FE